MASPLDYSWMDSVRTKLVATFAEKNPETLLRILHYLDEDERTYKDDQSIPPAWKSLKSILFSDKAFKIYAEQLAKDTETAERDLQFRKSMKMLFNQLMEASGDTLPENYGEEFDLARLINIDVDRLQLASNGLARAWSQIVKANQVQILKLLPKIIANQQTMISVDKAVGLVKKIGGNVAKYGLAAVVLTWDAYSNLCRWWKGEISGQRCLKNILDSVLTIGAGVAGGLGGAVVGALAGPVGSVIGGIVGGIITSRVMSILSDRMTQSLFGVPREEALENAYRYLGVSMTASNHEINTAYRQLCLKYHPDKPGGSNVDFHILQLNMAVIKVARGESN